MQSSETQNIVEKKHSECDVTSEKQKQHKISYLTYEVKA